MIIECIPVGFLQCNCYLVACNKTKEAVIIDPGDESGRIIKKIKELGITPKSIVFTHCHPDHTGAAFDLINAFQIPVLLHSKDMQLMGIDNGDGLVDDQILKCGNLDLKVIHTPGHSPGSICLLTENTLFSGDTLFAESVGRCDLPGGSQKELMNSIKDKILPLPNSTRVLPGHGPETDINTEKELNPFLR